MKVEGKTALLLFTLVAAALAGCTGPEADPEPTDEVEPQGSEAPQTPGLVDSEDAANATQPDDQSEFAKSLDEKFHTHNYWGGALERILLDDSVDSGPMAPSPFGDLLAHFTDVSLSEGFGHTRVLLPEGSIVPPETERMEITVTYTTSPTLTGMRLGYAAANDPNGVITDLGPVAEGGQTFEILPTIEQNDIPHTVESKWRFFLIPYNNANPTAPGLLNGSAHLLVTVFRSDVLLVAPPHPDFWGANTTQHLFTVDGDVKGERVMVPLLLPGQQNGFEFVQPPQGVIVPPHTGLLTLDLTWTNNAGTPDAFNSGLELYYNPPNAFHYLRAETSQSGPGQASYTIPVDARMWDSPYSTESAWTFLVAVDSDAASDQGTFFGDVALFDGTYQLHAMAEREVV